MALRTAASLTFGFTIASSSRSNRRGSKRWIGSRRHHDCTRAARWQPFSTTRAARDEGTYGQPKSVAGPACMVVWSAECWRSWGISKSVTERAGVPTRLRFNAGGEDMSPRRCSRSRPEQFPTVLAGFGAATAMEVCSGNIEAVHRLRTVPPTSS